MNSYIFITTEGFTFQPGSESAEPDVENCQVIGFAKGNSIDEAFENLIAENKYLLKTSFLPPFSSPPVGRQERGKEKGMLDSIGISL